MAEKLKDKFNDEELKIRATSDEKITVKLTNNYAFQKIFKNTKIVKGFLMALLDLKEYEIKKIEITDPFTFGIYNATNEGYTTWYEFTKEILAEQGINCKANPVTTEEYIEMMKITQAKRPFNSQMSKAKLEACGIKVPEWKDGLKRYLEEVKENEE